MEQGWGNTDGASSRIAGRERHFMGNGQDGEGRGLLLHGGGAQEGECRGKQETKRKGDLCGVKGTNSQAEKGAWLFI